MSWVLSFMAADPGAGLREGGRGREARVGEAPKGLAEPRGPDRSLTCGARPTLGVECKCGSPWEPLGPPRAATAAAARLSSRLNPGAEGGGTGAAGGLGTPKGILFA